MFIQKTCLIVLGILVLALKPVAADQDIDLKLLQGIRNVIFLQDDVIGGGAPSQEDLEEMKRQGFKSVIDLRTVIEGTLFAKGEVEKLGIKYFNIPVFSPRISKEQVNKLEKILTDPDNKPALLHCMVGGRVNMLWQQYKKKD